MDQTALPVTAPNDPDPRWPEGYVAVLRAAGAKEKTIPCCIGWVMRFFSAFPGRRRSELGRAEIETFPDETAERSTLNAEVRKGGERVGDGGVPAPKTGTCRWEVPYALASKYPKLNKGPLGVVSPVDTL